jgi:hypothetical protein
VRIPSIAAWDGHKWCGSTTDFHRSPISIVPLEDTLIALFYEPAIINGQQMPNIVYFDGDYLNNPNTICSSEDIGFREEVLPKETFSIYPNPNKGDFTIASTSEEPIKEAELCTLQGQVIEAWSWSTKPSSVELKTAGLAAGVYVLKVNGSHAQQIIIH